MLLAHGNVVLLRKNNAAEDKIITNSYSHLPCQSVCVWLEFRNSAEKPYLTQWRGVHGKCLIKL